MITAKKRFGYATVSAFVFHLLVFIATAFFINNEIYLTNQDIFQTMDYIESVNQGSEAESIEISDKIFFEDNTFEIIFCYENEIDNILPILNVSELNKTKNKPEIKHKFAKIVSTPAIKPKLIKRTVIQYPAKANGSEGCVTVCILVGCDGRAEYVSTAKSSGNPFLDGAAVEECIKWKFMPARDKEGRKVRCLIYIPVDIKK